MKPVVGDYVETPTGAGAWVIFVDELFEEATVQWLSRGGEQADFRWSQLKKATKRPMQ